VALVTRCAVKVRNLKDPKDELTIALSKLKKKIKETGIFMEYLEHQTFKRPAVKRKEKSIRARARSRSDAARSNPDTQIFF
jgi:ribosomal protein S21